MNNQGETIDRREQIMAAALSVFSLKGFHKATNKDIADAAGGISPGLIYHYFSSKEDLFFALIRERASFVQVATQSQALMDREPHEVLTLIATSYLSMVAAPANIALLRIMISEVFRIPQLSDALYRGVMAPVFGSLVNYMQLQIDRGRLKPHDPAIAVRSFMGMLIAHVLMRELFHQPEANATSDEAVIKQVVATFLEGLGQDS
jgi:AcrR family transcriptional regulator